MAINWQDVLTNLGTTLVSGVVVVGAAAWVIRTLASHGLTRDIEGYKSQLQQAALEHQVRFSNLHEERAKRIADLYGRIAAQSVACQRYVHQFGQVNRQEGFAELEAQFADLYLFLETSRIYLPEHICILLDKLIGEVRKAVVGVYVYSGTTDHANANVQEERSKTFLGAVKAFEVEIPAAKKVLEDEFRKMLGVDNSRPK